MSWKGGCSAEAALKGLRTRYAHGHVGKDALVRALRREADRLERLATKELAPQPWKMLRARALRSEADILEGQAPKRVNRQEAHG